MPKWFELRAATQPVPVAAAFSIARRIDLTPATIPKHLSPSTTAVEGVS
jgi:hypothetical protein